MSSMMSIARLIIQSQEVDMTRRQVVVASPVTTIRFQPVVVLTEQEGHGLDIQDATYIVNLIIF